MPQFNLFSSLLICVFLGVSAFMGMAQQNSSATLVCHQAIEGYHSDDIQVLEEIIRLNELKISPLKLGRQVWENGRLTWFALGEDEVHIHELPDNLGQLSSLTHLFLSGNHLQTIPGSIGKLIQLKALYLNDNALKTLPGSIGQLRLLENLYLNNNKLEAIPASLGKLTQLRNLYLNNNYITNIPEAVAQLPALRNLYF